MLTTAVYSFKTLLNREGFLRTPEAPGRLHTEPSSSPLVGDAQAGVIAIGTLGLGDRLSSSGPHLQLALLRW